MNIQLRHWIGKFGQAYTVRNRLFLTKMDKMYKKRYGITRTGMNKLFLNNLSRSIKILEVGANIGTQLILLQNMGFKNLYGIEPQEYACKIAEKSLKNVKIIAGDIFDIPFKDKYFDLVFTSGVLIHIHPRKIKKALKEIYRCSSKYIWGFEYYAKSYQEIPYHGKRNLLWKADFPKIYLDIFSDLKLVKIKHIKYLANNNIDMMFLLKKND